MAITPVQMAAGPVVTARPLPNHPSGQQQDDHGNPLLGPRLKPGRQLGLQDDQREPDTDQDRRVT
jgi:hypothetical protein